MRRKLTSKEAQAIQSACDDLDFRVYEQYSGRAMYGKNCFGIVTGAPGAELKLVVQLLQNVDNDEEKDIVMELLENMSECVSSDSMGRDAIYYYPLYFF